EIRSSHILIEFKPGAGASEKALAKKRATEILSEVKKSKRPFPELVKLYSDDSLSKAAGGDIGYQSKVTAVPTYYNAAKSTPIGKIHPILVETRFGFHIIKTTGIRKNFEEADRRQIRAVVFEAKRKKIFDQFFRDLKRKYKISINKAALKGLK
ncbi:MAG: peptidylprolyl isomerase, partial [Bdellovibrionales bacterium]|nr:peptidylprolyl isomerase [Bdellovibrionales bacterium]